MASTVPSSCDGVPSTLPLSQAAQAWVSVMLLRWPSFSTCHSERQSMGILQACGADSLTMGSWHWHSNNLDNGFWNKLTLGNPELQEDNELWWVLSLLLHPCKVQCSQREAMFSPGLPHCGTACLQAQVLSSPAMPEVLQTEQPLILRLFLK